MSVALLTLTLGLVPPPPPPEEAPLDTLEAEAGDASERSDASGSEAEPALPEAVDAPPAPATAPEAEIHYDAYGDPIVPYGEADLTQGELPFAEQSEPAEELPYADDATLAESQQELEYADRPARTTMSREALERQASVELDGGPIGGGASPQRFALEVKFGPYLPNVDGTTVAGDFGPYATIFGETNEQGVTVGAPRQGVFSVVGFEWQFLNFGGPISIGGQVGYFRDRADGILSESQDGSIRSRADRVSFNVVPVAVLLGYRFELLADRYRVPLVPYARGGLAYGFWWSKDGSGDVSVNSAGQKGRGGSLGWQANLGMMIQMDFIDRGSARALDRNTGINHTYLFGEYQFSRLDGFGSDRRMSVGDDTYMLGLAIEF